MKFLIKCKTDDVKEMYSNHSTYHKGDSGLDLFIIEDITIEPGEMKLVGLGIQCQLQSNVWYCPWKKNYHSYMMFPRSSICKSPLRLANSIGLIDGGYLGELKAALYNTSDKSFNLKKGERYVQLVLPNLSEVSFEVVSELRDTSRGNQGFGSTGGVNIDEVSSRCVQQV
jgi:dUTP pyrophosphatase